MKEKKENNRNPYLNIIPTPKECHFTEGDALWIHKVYCNVPVSKRLEHSYRLLQKECPFTFVGKEEADLMIICGGEEVLAEKAGITREEQGMFEEKYASEQGYLIKKQKDGSVIIAAREELGCVYGIMTLIQILGKKVSSISIRDWPDFLHRGIKWLIWAETGIWSYDFGDGAEKTKNRLIRKLDLMLRYKLNYVTADGFGFDVDRFPEYADIMRCLCDNARERGIYIGTGGYATGYGMSAFANSYQGKAFWNRKPYPDGEPYECIGTYYAWAWTSTTTVDRTVRLKEIKGRTQGTCLSNEALLEDKLDELVNYIRKTHIGGIYLHNMDAHEMHPELWKARCEACRCKWPNDDLFARDGAAGAFAYYFDKIMERIRTVKDGEYDAARDLIVTVVSPGYCFAEATSDEDFDTSVKFWAAVTEYMTNAKNVAIGFREQFFYHSKNERRMETISKLVKKVHTDICFFWKC